MKELFFLLLLLLPIIPSFGWAATYTVCSSGCNYTTIQSCADIVAHGDTCSVGAGSYNERVTISASGTVNGTGCTDWITFSGSSRTANVNSGFLITGSCVAIDSFTIDPWTGQDYTCDNVSVQCRNAIAFTGSNNKANNNYVHGWRGEGAISGTRGISWASRPSNNIISNNYLYQCQQAIGVWGDNWSVTGNEINRLYAWTSGDDCDYMRAWGIGLTVSNNFFHGTILSEVGGAHVDCLQTWAGGGAYLSNLTYNQNWCSENHELISQYSASNANYAITNNVFANGLIAEGTTRGGGLDLEGVVNVTITGNTFYNTGAAGWCDYQSTNCLARNNLVVFNLPNPATLYAWQTGGSGSSEDHNLAYQLGGGTLNVTWSLSPNPPNATDITDQDPLFVNTSSILGADGIPFTADDGLRLQAGSPARGAGYGGVDIGAYEYGPGGGDTTPPTVTAFTIPATSNSLTVPITTFTATDNVAVTGYLINESASTPSVNDLNWRTTQTWTSTGYTVPGITGGVKTLYAWAKDAAGNISTSLNASVTITDIAAPTVTLFDLPLTYANLTVPINYFNCSDNFGVSAYCVTLVNISGGCSTQNAVVPWQASAPARVTFPYVGIETAFAWCKDAAGNVSNSAQDTVDITLPPTQVAPYPVKGGGIYGGGIR